MLTSIRALEVTRRKLKRLEEAIAESERDDSCKPEVRELEVRSLKQLANQLREEIVRFETKTPNRAVGPS